MVDFKMNMDSNMSVLSKQKVNVERQSDSHEVSRPDIQKHVEEATRKTAKADPGRDQDQFQQSNNFSPGAQANQKLRELFLQIYQDIGYAPTMAEQRVDNLIGEFPPRIDHALGQFESTLVDAGIDAPAAINLNVSISINKIEVETRDHGREQIAFRFKEVGMAIHASDPAGRQLAQPQPLVVEFGNEGAAIGNDGKAHHGVVAKAMDTAKRETGQKAQEDPFQQSLVRVFGAERVVNVGNVGSDGDFVVHVDVGEVVDIDRPRDDQQEAGGDRQRQDADNQEQARPQTHLDLTA